MDFVSSKMNAVTTKTYIQPISTNSKAVKAWSNEIGAKALQYLIQYRLTSECVSALKTLDKREVLFDYFSIDTSSIKSS